MAHAARHHLRHHWQLADHQELKRDVEKEEAGQCACLRSADPGKQRRGAQVCDQTSRHDSGLPMRSVMVATRLSPPNSASPMTAEAPASAAISNRNASESHTPNTGHHLVGSAGPKSNRDPGQCRHGSEHQQQAGLKARALCWHGARLAGITRQITNSIPAPNTARTGKGACQPNLAMSNPIAGTPAMNAADHASSVIATAVPRFSYATRWPISMHRWIEQALAQDRQDQRAANVITPGWITTRPAPSVKRPTPTSMPKLAAADVRDRRHERAEDPDDVPAGQGNSIDTISTPRPQAQIRSGMGRPSGAWCSAPSAAGR